MNFFVDSSPLGDEISFLLKNDVPLILYESTYYFLEGRNHVYTTHTCVSRVMP
jgi:hypothetical protein